jgi:hypothetical protein
LKAFNIWSSSKGFLVFTYLSEFCVFLVSLVTRAQHINLLGCTSNPVFYLGAAVVTLDHSKEITKLSANQRWTKNLLVIYLAKPIAIYHAIRLIKTGCLIEQGSATEQCLITQPLPKITIISDSQSALKAIANPSNPPNEASQHIIYEILHAANRLKANGISIRL